MCIEKTKPRFDNKEVIGTPKDPNIVIYYKEISKKDPRVFRVMEFEEALVVCPRGELSYVDVHGFYKIISVPARVVWVRTGRLAMTVGVPRGMTPDGVGINADVVLILHNAEAFLKNIPKIAREGAITSEIIKEELRRLLLSAIRNIGSINTNRRKELLEEIHKEMNSLIIRSWLNGFVIDVQSIGFSTDCVFSRLIEEGD